MEQNNLEQPMVEEQAQPEADSEMKENVGAESSLLEGSNIKKFKSTESLLKAYENLQAEFTRKSQKLSEVSKELNALKDNASVVKAPFNETQDYDKIVDTFFESNPSAKKYASEISEHLLEDNKKEKPFEPIEVAYTKMLADKFLNLEDTLQKDNSLLERILQNKTVQEFVIKNYLQSLKEQKITPVISTHNGSGFSLTPKQKPLNLEEAKLLAEALFKI